MSQHIVDLTQEAEEGSQENPHDLTHEELQDLEELAVIEARTRAAGYGAVHTEGADEDLPQDLRATYTNLPAATPGQEQNRDFELKDGTFMRVIGRARDSRHEEWIIGRRLYPQHAPGLLMPQPRTRDELVWLSYCDKDRDEYGRNVRVRARDVRRKCKIIFTNAPHQVLNSALVRNGQDNLFFCRWRRMITLPENSANGPINGHKAGTIENIGVESADPESIELRDGRLMSASTATAEIRKRFRGTENCDLGGDTLGEDDSGTFIQKYSFADFFCGAGGASQGALDADLSLRLALDHDEVAILTYKTNFARPGLDIREVDISEFIRNHRAEEGRRWIVDVLHASPPCQPFSPANTTPNMARNAINEASLTMVFDILVICKPRMVTIEETEGILRPRHRDFFQGLISYFIDHGYSVHWRAIDMKRYGVPQTRKRLILIASGPGESLPPFPAPTHGPEAGLQPPPTIARAIGNLPFHPEFHNPATMGHFQNPRRPLDWNGLSGTITCNGGGSNVYHPDGRRKHTTRELLALQTFPPGFIVAGDNLTLRRRQIGNAVPPALARTLFKTVLDWLKQRDADEARGIIV